MSYFKCLIVIFFISISGHSQDYSGLVTYNVNADGFKKRLLDSRNGKPDQGGDFLLYMIKELDRIKFSLVFNDTISIYSRLPGLAADNKEKAYKLAVSFSDRGSFYSNIKNKELFLIKEYQGEVLTVKSEYNEFNWELLQEKKEIKGYTCFKAVSTVETPAGEFPLVAWYTPEIPFSYGPLDYGGKLPGLIIELETNELNFVCSNIILNPDTPLEINWLNTKKAMSIEKFKEIERKIKVALNRN